MSAPYCMPVFKPKILPSSLRSLACEGSPARQKTLSLTVVEGGLSKGTRSGGCWGQWASAIS